VLLVLEVVLVCWMGRLLDLADLAEEKWQTILALSKIRVDDK